MVNFLNLFKLVQHGLQQLQQLVPGCNQSDVHNGVVTKTSKAQVLQKAIDYVNYMVKDRDRKKQEIAEMEKKLSALKIMKENYEQLVRTSDAPAKSEISDDIKFNVFKYVMNALWESFSVTVVISSFQSLSGTVISWLESYCKPDMLKSIVVNAVRSTLG